MTEDLGWAPVPPANLPWNAINQLILFNLATENGPGLDASNIENINVPNWVATAHAHPGVKAIIAIGGAGNDNWGGACNAANRAQFVQNLVGFATSNAFDGIDLDIEDGPWAAQNPPVAAMTNCIEAISNAAHSAGLFLSADVITNWEGPWYAPSQAFVDQYNLMTYGDNLATMKSDVADTINQGLPASKFVVGVDVDEHPQPPGGCGQFSGYAAQAGLMGAFVWDAAADARSGNACANGLAAG
jgi:chitinase